MKAEYLECGKICSPHGVRGVVKVEPWCDSPKVLARAKAVYLKSLDGYRRLPVTAASISGAFLLMTLEGISTREDAQAYKNTTLYLHRSDIPVPKGAMLIADMIGLPVTDADSGRLYGTLSDVTDGVGYQIYSVKTEGGEVLLPAVAEFVKEIGEDGIKISPIPGFFD